MASEKHKLLAEFVKSVHSSLRKDTLALGAEVAWQKHCNNEKKLQRYAFCMQELATTFWQENILREDKPVCSRIAWCADICLNYFMKNLYLEFREKELKIALRMQINPFMPPVEEFRDKLKLLDVGSCYNPFDEYNYFDVLAIDLYPANDKVLQCDFLCCDLGTETIVKDNKLVSLQEASFDVVTFCFLLEYLPTSTQRIKACLQAYKILKVEGILIITTPDSKHVGANYKLMKCWRYTLALIGFSRIKYEKLPHMHCMAFRKSVNQNIAGRWASINKKDYMSYEICIPQDCNSIESIHTTQQSFQINPEDFKELPFHLQPM